MKLIKPDLLAIPVFREEKLAIYTVKSVFMSWIKTFKWIILVATTDTWLFGFMASICCNFGIMCFILLCCFCLQLSDGWWWFFSCYSHNCFCVHNCWTCNEKAMAGSGSSMLYSFLLFTVILSLQEMYRGKLASSELYTILGGFVSSLLFLVLLTVSSESISWLLSQLWSCICR